MARGTAGYGRYESDLTHVGCPWSGNRSEVPCAARDGRLAITDPPVVCVGCGNSIPFLLRDLADDYPPAAAAITESVQAHTGLDEAADTFRDLVLAATAPLTEGKTGDRPEPEGG